MKLFLTMYLPGALSLNRKRPFAKKTGQVTKWGAVHKNHPHAKNTLALRKKYENGVGYKI